MTFKIDKAGIYKNRKGERVEITGQASSGQWWRIDGKGYHDDGRRIDRDYKHEDIIAHWEEPTVGCITNAHTAVNPNSNTTMAIGTNHKAGKAEPLELEEFTHETDCKSKFYAVVTEDLIYSGFYTLDEAQKDAKNRACENPKVKFYVMQAVAAYTGEVEIKEIKI